MNAFHDAYAGQEFRVPVKLRSDSPLIPVIGVEAANALVSACGGTEWQIPSNRERRVCELYAEGKSPNEIATALTMTTRGVRRLLRVCGLVKHQPRRRPSADSPATTPKGIR